MTRITFYTDANEEITGFRAEGHAGFAEEGEDIVCSAITALINNTINSINELTESEALADIDEEENYIDVSFFEPPCKEARLLLRSLALGLTNMEDDEECTDFIDVIFEED
jgi:hypothetical protein